MPQVHVVALRVRFGVVYAVQVMIAENYMGHTVTGRRSFLVDLGNADQVAQAIARTSRFECQFVAHATNN